MSSSSGLEEMINATHMVGRAIAAITFPGMHRIYDFHSPRAPKLKNISSFFMFRQEEEEDEEIDENQFTTEELESIFFVQVGNDKIYLEDPLYENESGWTPLHTCCMSFLTVPAGMKLIEYISENGGAFDTKTIIGPGTFNKGWTPLHMFVFFLVVHLLFVVVAHLLIVGQLLMELNHWLLNYLKQEPIQTRSIVMVTHHY